EQRRELVVGHQPGGDRHDRHGAQLRRDDDRLALHAAAAGARAGARGPHPHPEGGGGGARDQRLTRPGSAPPRRNITRRSVARPRRARAQRTSTPATYTRSSVRVLVTSASGSSASTMKSAHLPASRVPTFSRPRHSAATPVALRSTWAGVSPASVISSSS